MVGYRPEALKGVTVFDLIHPEDLSAAQRAFAEILRGDVAPALAIRVRHQDGRWVTLEVSGAAIADEEGGPMVLGVARDITERRRLEEELRQAQKMEAVGRLAGGVAHDFNNMLTAIAGYAELSLAGLTKDSPLRRNLEEIARAAERAASLTRQLLAFSRRQLLQPRVVDLNAAVAAAESMLRRLVGEDVEFTTRLEPALWPVKIDPGQIDQVLMNLAANARAAMPRGGTLTIETHDVEVGPGEARLYPELTPGPYVLLSVSDTGVGMDEETRAHVFEPFFTTRVEGTGLGLATVYGIVQQSGGQIWVESEPGRGTIFRLAFPRSEEPLESALAPVPLAPSGSRGHETILLVEDEDAVRGLVRRTLEGAGYRILEAAAPSEALRLVAAHQGSLDLVLTDVVLPEMSGRELAARLHESRPDTAVLYVSGYDEDAVVHHGVLDSDIAFLAKPFSPDELARRVRQLLDAPRSP